MAEVCPICDIEGCRHIRKRDYHHAQVGGGTEINSPAPDSLTRIAAALERIADAMPPERERAAIAALTGLLAAGKQWQDGWAAHAQQAYMLADAMLAERARQPDEAPR